MTVSEHVYEAYLIGSPDVELSVKGGSITLDATRAPHVTGNVTISVPSLATLADLDNREAARIRLTALATFPTASQSRTFDLVLRDRGVPQSDGTVELTVASDEALFMDYAPLADDITPRGLQASLRGVVNYVLNKVIPGAALEAAPANDHNSTRYWAVTNLITNPTGELDAVNWSAGDNASAPVSVPMSVPAARTGSRAIGFYTLGAGDANIRPTLTSTDTTTYAVTPGEWYVWDFYIVSSVARSCRAAIQWWSADGTILSSTSYGTASTSSTTTWGRRSLIAQAPEGASHGLPFVNTLGNGATNYHYVEDAMFYEGDELVPNFSGATTDTADYIYDWSATAHASTSTRTPTAPVDKESLTWRTGQTALEFLAPLVQVAGLRLVCNEARDWTLRDEDYVAPGSLAIRYGVNLIDGSDTIPRDSNTWFDAAVTEYTDPGTQVKTVDAFALTIPHTMLRTFTKDVPFPGVGFSEYAVRRAQGRGREVSATAVADWRAQAEQESVFVLEGAPTQTGRSDKVQYDLDNDRMTVTSRTTDTGAGSINLLTGTINALTGTINGL